MEFNIKLNGQELSIVLNGLSTLQGSVAAVSDAIVNQANAQQPAPQTPETPSVPAA